MAFSVAQLKFLRVVLKADIPPDFLERGVQREEYLARRAALDRDTDAIARRHDAREIKNLLEQAAAAATENHHADALDFLDRVEHQLSAPDVFEKTIQATVQQTGREAPSTESLIESASSEAFVREYALRIPLIDAAAEESAEIGGADIASLRDRMDDREAARDWPAAMKLLLDAHRKAILLYQRKPYIVAKQRHQHAINAAKKIALEIPPTENRFRGSRTYGEAVGARWDAIANFARAGDFKSAASGILSLARLIDTAIKPLLEESRQKNADELKSLKTELELAKSGEQRSRERAAKLRDLAEKILANTAAAEKLGVDPGENARKAFDDRDEPVWKAERCKETFIAHDWFALKKFRKAGSIPLGGVDLTFDDDAMWKLVQYRGKVVNEEIDRLRKKYPTLIAKASGSEDIESDIDITFATPGSGDDVKAAAEFNQAIIGTYRKPAGRTFDVNIYPRDYSAIKESFKADYNVEEIKDQGIDEPEEDESMKLSQIDQDVATLLKQRRFMDGTKFKSMLNALETSAPDEATRRRIQKQYEEGDAIFLETSREKVKKIREKIQLPPASPADSEALKHLRKSLEELDSLRDLSSLEDLHRAQELLPEVLDLFEELEPAQTMEVTDALYLEKMSALREDQEKIRLLKQEDADEEEQHPGKECDELHPGVEHEDWAQETLNALSVKVKKDMFTNIVFANEAIMSQGALKHVVVALQAKTDEEKRAALNVLKASDLMQSVNEQVADLAKEMKHFDGVASEAAKESPAAARRAFGEGCVHASKYFFRLLDAAILFNQKYAGTPAAATVSAPYAALKTKKNPDLTTLKIDVDKALLRLRKSAVLPADVKGELGALEMDAIFVGITDLASFRKMITDFAIEVNQRIRSLKDFQESQQIESEKERKAEQAYFKVAAPKPERPADVPPSSEPEAPAQTEPVDPEALNREIEEKLEQIRAQKVTIKNANAAKRDAVKTATALKKKAPKIKGVDEVQINEIVTGLAPQIVALQDALQLLQPIESGAKASLALIKTRYAAKGVNARKVATLKSAAASAAKDAGQCYKLARKYWMTLVKLRDQLTARRDKAKRAE